MDSLLIWILFAVLAPLLFAAVNQIDGFLVKKVSTPGSLVVFSSLFAIVTIVISLIIALVQGVGLSLPGIQIGILIVSGVFEIAWLYWYMQALETEEVSSVVPWFQIVPVFVLILSIVFLGERMSGLQIFGIGIVVIGSAVLSRNFTEKFRFKKRESLLMIGAAFIIAAGSVLYKVAAIDTVPFWTSMFWLHIGVFGTGVVAYMVPSFRSEFHDMITTNGRKVLGWNVLNEVLNLGGLLALLYATFLASKISYVYTISAIQPHFVLALSAVLSKLSPSFVSEDLSGKNLFFKIIAIVLLIIGGVLVAGM